MEALNFILREVFVLLRRGGKGGFGSLLRGSRKSSQTDNNDACRDLSGRRIRVVSAEQKLEEWAATEAKRKLDKEVYKERKERTKAERAAANKQVDAGAIQKEQGAALLGMQKALESSLKAGVKRNADHPKQPLAIKPLAKRPRYESSSEGSDSESVSNSKGEEEDEEDATCSPTPKPPLVQQARLKSYA